MPAEINLNINPAFEFLYTEKRRRFVVLKGGSGSGKSVAAFQYLITRVISEPGCNALVARKIARTLRFSVFAQALQVLKELDLLKLCDVNKSDKEIKYRPNGNQIFFVGMDDPEKIKSITAETGNIELILCEEASEYDQADLDQLNARLRGDSGIDKQMIIPFNPISEEHWLKKAFWDEKQYEDVRISETTYKDNLSLDDAYKRQLESYKHSNPYFYSVYCLGEWGSIEAGDTIIPYHLANAARHRDEVSAEGRLQVGLDVARYGDDSSVSYIRRGMKVLGKRSVQGRSAKPVSEMVISLITIFLQKSEVCTVNIDATGNGSGVVDMMKHLTRHRKNINIVEVHFGGKAENSDAYGNCVTEMYYNMNAVLKEAKLLKHDGDVIPELTKRKYRFKENKSVMLIEEKKDFKKRTQKSPDNADALVLCFYEGKGAEHPYNHIKNFLNNMRQL